MVNKDIYIYINGKKVGVRLVKQGAAHRNWASDCDQDIDSRSELDAHPMSDRLSV